MPQRKDVSRFNYARTTETYCTERERERQRITDKTDWSAINSIQLNQRHSMQVFQNNNN